MRQRRDAMSAIAAFHAKNLKPFLGPQVHETRQDEQG